MAPRPTKSSRSSLVSIDPAVVRHIESPVVYTSSHTLSGFGPTSKYSNTPATIYTRGHGRNNSAPVKNHSKRSNSLRRAKNSTEMLRQRSLRRERDARHTDHSSDTKRGRNFTVTNVGTGGMLYLRPSAHQAPMSPALSPPPAASLTAPATSLVMPQEKETYLIATEHNPHGRAPASRTRSVSPKRLLQRISKAKEESAARPLNARSQSFSTLDESRKSITSSWPKTLKIIINRIDPASAKPADIELKPSLEIPIPHYRLGVPRFSTHGTPILRSSTYSRASSLQSNKRSSLAKSEGASSAPPPASLKAFAKIQTLDPAIDLPLGQGEQSHGRRGTENSQQTSDSIGSPLTPSIYDDLTDMYNDPTVVRFAHDVRDVTAATPARIIAQISSESFMDYELVSDFFLTFRSYMSTYQVLNLLLARLAWAVGRMSDDGRIIRIRTFAALRHWILNYFMDDFVPHRKLRERFCQEVNELYSNVRSKQVGGPSDLKILQDLKRCWNGRCSLYWDGEEFSMDTNQDAELSPGGIIGSRNPAYTDIREVQASSAQLLNLVNQPPTTPSQHTTSSNVGRKSQHARQHSSHLPSGHAESVRSEQSIQPNSCSILLNPMRSAADLPNHSKRPHPVTVLERRQKAPSDLQVVTNRPGSTKAYHKRGGSSFDSTRERTPLGIASNNVPWIEPHDGSVIRGFVYAPVEPFVHISSNMPLSPSEPFEKYSASPGTSTENANYITTGSPTMKNIFGSIRRVLSGRQEPNDMTMITISAPYSNQSLAGRKSPMPLNLSKSHDELRSKATPVSPISPIRIDLLCAAAVESYQSIVPGMTNINTSETPLEMLKAGSMLTPPQIQGEGRSVNRRPDRVQSNLTAQSGSILIVDGTGLGIPMMSGAVQYDQFYGDPSTDEAQTDPVGRENEGHVSFETQIAFQEEAQDDRSNSLRVSLREGDKQSPEQQGLGIAGNLYSTATSTVTVKKEPSPTNSATRFHTQSSVEDTDSTATSSREQESGTTDDPKGPPQILRRRPGGDLRKNQNVHDMESAAPHHESLDSIMDTASSPAESILIIGNIQPPPPPQAYKLGKQDMKQVSMINTHSSQHLRPSFEAAVAGFSAIPDDDDGGLEATLLKLEGRYDKESPPLQQRSPSIAPSDVLSRSTISASRDDDSSPIMHRQDMDDEEITHDADRRYAKNIHEQVTTSQPHLAQGQAALELPAGSTASSENSSNSLPILHRKSTVAAERQRRYFPGQQGTWSQVHPLFSHNEQHSRQELSAEPEPDRYNDKDQNLLRPTTAHTNRSFLLDEDENLSDLSSEMSVDIINYSEALGDSSSPMLVAPGTAVSGLEIPSHPLAHSSFVNLSMHPSLALDAGSSSKNRPLTPETPPPGGRTAKREQAQPARNMLNQKLQRTQIPVGPAHVPFILACDSQMLAQQLTLVEQSALTEIEWTDLVEMRWSSQPADVLDWAEYVTKQDVKGVDLVITRFNLMVKWTISEIVLTQNMEERVRVITKFIHVAAHARRLHNYATMLQITIALTSTDCTRLAKTWQLVSAPDKSLLKNMEALIQPIRNFHDLRLEMESADLTDGCVPFIGLYVHDLTYNAQKPAEIDAGKGQQPLINFERFRTSAVIVKGLLRLIDASSKYKFEPVHGIIERCLWIAVLEDERIRTLSRTVEGVEGTT